MTVDKVIAKIIWLTFFWPTLYANKYECDIDQENGPLADAAA